MEKKQNLITVISLITGVVGLLFSILLILAINLSVFLFTFLLLLVTILFGHISLKKIKKSQVNIAGKGRSIIGLIFGYTGMLILFLPFILPTIKQIIYNYSNPPNYEIVFQLQDTPKKKITHDILLKSEKFLSINLERLKRENILYDIKNIDPDTIIFQLTVSDTAILNQLTDTTHKKMELSFNYVEDPKKLINLIYEIDKTVRRIFARELDKTDISLNELKELKKVDDQEISLLDDLQGNEPLNQDEDQFIIEHPFYSLLLHDKETDRVFLQKENIDAFEQIANLSEIKEIIPKGFEIVRDRGNYISDKYVERLYLVKRDTSLSGYFINDVSIIQSGDDAPGVSFEFDEDGKKIFSTVSGSNIGKELAIVRYKRIVVLVMINIKITSGRIMIPKLQSKYIAEEIAYALRAGAIPPWKLIKIRNLLSGNN